MPKKPKPEVIRRYGGGACFYASNVEISQEFFGLKIVLLDVSREREECPVTVSETATIAFSPQHAKVFSAHLAKAIVQYEMKYGKIPDRPTDKTGCSRK